MIIMIIIIANMIMVIRVIYLVCMKAMCLTFATQMLLIIYF